jgi:site-specific DNA-methyltransferase (adenine-specific)
MKNTLYYGDNLHVLRKYIGDDSIDLIYLDPPFNSRADYNLLFKEPTGKPSEAQITAFEDTWHWNQETEITFQDIVDTAPDDVVKMMKSFREFVKGNDVMAYLTMMCVRLLELRRVLKATGSIYLHCDPTAAQSPVYRLLPLVLCLRNFVGIPRIPVLIYCKAKIVNVSTSL